MTKVGEWVIVAHIRHAAVLQATFFVAPFAASHVPPFAAGIDTVNFCDAVPLPHDREHAPGADQLPTQFVAENKRENRK